MMLYQRNKYLILRDTLLGTIDRLSKEGNFLPALILIYTTIDILSWLDLGDVPDDMKYSVSSVFKGWVNKYVLEDHPSLNCTADDLYAARNGLVHTGTPESRDYHRSKTVKLIRYAAGYQSNLGNHAVSIYSGPHDEHHPFERDNGRQVVVKIADLSKALREGARKFTQYFESDPNKRKIVYSRVNRYFETLETVWLPQKK